jgi:hypothetical protein
MLYLALALALLAALGLGATLGYRRGRYDGARGAIREAIALLTRLDEEDRARQEGEPSNA